MNAAYLNTVCLWAGIDHSQSNNNGGVPTLIVFPRIQGTSRTLAGSGIPNAITDRELSDKADAPLNFVIFEVVRHSLLGGLLTRM